METFVNDVRLAMRRLVKQPLFTTIAIVTLAIGIGANSAIFTLVNGVLLRPLPFTRASELVWIHGLDEHGNKDALSAPAFLAIQKHNRSFTDVAVYSNGSATVTGLGEAERVRGGDVSASFFDVIRVKPLLGSVLPSDSDLPGKTDVIVISENYWRRKFSAAQDVVGRSIIVNGRARKIVGVMPQSAVFPVGWEYWRPIEYDASIVDPHNIFALWLTVIGRVKPGVSPQQANQDVAAIFKQAQVDAQMVNPKFTAATTPLHEMATGDVRRPLLILLGAVGLVLLIACANLANLLLAQAATRSTDFAVRRALGASPWRLVRQLVAESVTLALVGGGCGLLLGAWGADALLAMLPPDMPHMPNVHLDGTVVAFTAALSFAAAVLFGMAPAMHVKQGALSEMLREGARGGVSRGSLRTRALLVIGETALAFSLVIGAGLLIRTLNALTHVNPGFRTDHTLSFQLSLPESRYESDPKVAAFYDELMTRVSSIPGVASAGAVMNLPLSGSDTDVTFDVDGRPKRAPGDEAVLEVHMATPGYFKTLGIPLKSGRLFDDRDRPGVPPVALISEDAAKTYFPNENPIGKKILMGWHHNGALVQGTVVGIVGGTRQNRLRDAAAPLIYFPESQFPQSDMAVTVRSTGDPMALQTAMRDAVHGIDPDLAIARMSSLDEVMNTSVATDRFMTLLLAVFSAMALLLAAVGIFGVISYGVAQRRREFGVRMAVGASRREIVGLVLQGGMRLTVAGLFIGGAAALALTRVMNALLFGVKPSDPATYVLAAVGLLVVAVVASALPAWSASRLPPSAVLNTD